MQLPQLSKKTWIIIGIIALIIIVIVIIYIQNKKSNETDVKGAEKINPVSTTGILNAAGVFKPEVYPLAIYMKGPNVLRLQKLLNSKGYTPKLVEDGAFGTKTEAGLLSIYGTKTATEAQLTQWEKDAGTPVSSVSIPDTGLSTGLGDYVGKLYNDLVNRSYYVSSRDDSTEGGIYKDLAGKSDQEFITIYNQYKSKYSRDLATDVNEAKFSFTTTSDSQIVDKARRLKLTTI